MLIIIPNTVMECHLILNLLAVDKFPFCALSQALVYAIFHLKKLWALLITF